MKVLIVSNGESMAGIGYWIKQAFDRFSTDVTVREIRDADNYIHYPADVHQPSTTQVRELYDEADLIHLMEYPWALAKWIPEQLSKSAIVHQHGTPYRYSSESLRTGLPQIVSTPDLILYGDETWLPNPVSVPDMKTIRKANYVKSDTIRLGHFPTFRDIKNSDDYERGAVSLRETNGIDYLLGMGLTHERTLQEKARCDILYDQLTLGYGYNGVEAGAMGLAVVGGFADTTIRDRFHDLTGGDSPLVEATVDSLHDVLEKLVVDKKRMISAQKKAHAFVKKFHDYPVAVKRLTQIWKKAYDEQR